MIDAVHSQDDSPEYLHKENTRVRVFTPSGIIEGDYPHPAGVRLSDSLRNAATAERYILLTDVTLRSLQGEPLEGGLGSAPFILLSTAHASLIIPLGE
jgi:hypothetical protein